jgi:hypothetical protein
LRSRQLRSHSRIYQNFTEPESSLSLAEIDVKWADTLGQGQWIRFISLTDIPIPFNPRNLEVCLKSGGAQ